MKTKTKETVLTPMMKQYREIKEKNKEYILFFRLGDFYEMFDEDAEEISQFLNLTLTSRRGKDQKIPMCGIPYHASENYIVRLIKGGYKIAICEQVEDPAKAKGIVKREVVRYYTAGTIVADRMLNAKENSFLACYFQGKHKIGLSFIDVSTGEFKTIEFDHISQLMNEIQYLQPKELIFSESQELPSELLSWIKKEKTIFSAYDDYVFSYDNAEKFLKDFFGVQSLKGYGLENFRAGIQASAAILSYLKQIQKGELRHILKLQPYSLNQYMALDVETQRNLELLQNFHGRNSKATLFAVMDKTVTGAGARKLKGWMLHPLCRQDKINDRLEAVKNLISSEKEREEIRTLLKSIADLQRIVGRLNANLSNARDLVAIKHTLQKIPNIRNILNQMDSSLLSVLKNCCREMPDLFKLLNRALVDEPPFSIREGGMICPGYSKELDEVHNIKNNIKEWLASFENKERQKTGIKTLKVKYNKVFGYYIEISKSQVKLVPDNYLRKQTTVNGERYIISELKEKEAIILGASERINKIEHQLFQSISLQVSKETASLQRLANALAVLDVLQSFAEIAVHKSYVKPEITEGNDICIEAGRHPVVEDLLEEERFVVNDVFLSNKEEQLLVITGPNMSGKSTYIRQIALITYMAHLGSFVPAKKAEICLVDRIFTRIGASDDLSQGQSTFMLEMNETSNILNNATAKSLIILDEVGRGTSTVDGVSIAWAIAEFLHNELKAKTIFATHYHELTELEKRYPNIINYNVSCKEMDGTLFFSHRIRKGRSDKSYGIHVASLAGLPLSVIERARDLLHSFDLEQKNIQKSFLFSALEDNKDQSSDTKLEQKVSLKKDMDDIVEDFKNIDMSLLDRDKVCSLLSSWLHIPVTETLNGEKIKNV